MSLNIPQHTPDATPWLISEKDDAWDHARINSEIAAHGLSEDEHPFTRYQLAETRYDLDAPFTLPDGQTVPIRDYLRDEHPPARFKLRRLTPDEFATTQDYLLRGASSQAYTYAAKVGLTGLEGIDGVTFKKRRGQLEPKLVELLHRAGVLLEIGSAVYLLSKPLTEAEKK